MAQSFTQNRKKWLIGLSIIVAIFALAGYRYSKSHTQDDVLTIGISPPYAELLQSVADDVKKQGIQVKLVEFS
ncbi:MAG: methionine transporter, partial [Acinetobacter sp.]|nr:methionine transporter [Acinetobacter sp.]